MIARQCTGGVGSMSGSENYFTLGGGGAAFSGKGAFKAPKLQRRASAASNFPLATTALSTTCPSWMTLGVACITGHTNGDVHLWGVNWDEGTFVSLYFIQEKVHSCEITRLRILCNSYFSGGTGGEGTRRARGGGAGAGGAGGSGGGSGAVLGIGGGGSMEDTLLVGDKSGKVSIHKPLRLDSLSNRDLKDVLEEVEGRENKVGGGGFQLRRNTSSSKQGRRRSRSSSASAIFPGELGDADV